MLVLTLYWIILFGFFYQLSCWLKFNTQHVYPYTLSFLAVYGLGAFAMTVFSLFAGTPFWADYFLGAIGIFGTIQFFRNEKKHMDFSSWDLSHLWIVLLFLGWSSLHTKIPDEGLYYNQAVKWFEEMGLVKGLGNFDFFLIQGSALHAWSAWFNFDEMYSLNDINGFFALTFILETFKSFKNNTWIKLSTLLLLPILLLLSTSLSTDIIPIVGVACLTLVLFREEEFKTWMAWVIVGVLLTKVNAIVFAFYLFMLAVMLWKKWKAASIIALGTGLHFVKLFQTSGYLLAPFSHTFTLPNPHHIPVLNAKFSSIAGAQIGFNQVDYDKVAQWTAIDKLIHFFSMGKLEIISTLMVVSLVIYVLFFKKELKHKLYTLSALVFAFIWFFTSPQFRLAIPVFFGLAIYVFGFIHYSISKWITKSMKYTILILMSMLLLIPLGKLSFISENDFIATYDGFSWKQTLIPAPLYRASGYEEAVFEGFAYIKPDTFAYCFDGPFPCQASMLRTFNSDSVYYPVLLGEDLQDGLSYGTIALESFDTLIVEQFNAYSINYWKD